MPNPLRGIPDSGDSATLKGFRISLVEEGTPQIYWGPGQIHAPPSPAPDVFALRNYNDYSASSGVLADVFAPTLLPYVPPDTTRWPKIGQPLALAKMVRFILATPDWEGGGTTAFDNWRQAATDLQTRLAGYQFLYLDLCNSLAPTRNFLESVCPREESLVDNDFLGTDILNIVIYGPSHFASFDDALPGGYIYIPEWADPVSSLANCQSRWDALALLISGCVDRFRRYETWIYADVGDSADYSAFIEPGGGGIVYVYPDDMVSVPAFPIWLAALRAQLPALMGRPSVPPEIIYKGEVDWQTATYQTFLADVLSHFGLS